MMIVCRAGDVGVFRFSQPKYGASQRMQTCFLLLTFSLRQDALVTFVVCRSSFSPAAKHRWCMKHRRNRNLLSGVLGTEMLTVQCELFAGPFSLEARFLRNDVRLVTCGRADELQVLSQIHRRRSHGDRHRMLPIRFGLAVTGRHGCWSHGLPVSNYGEHLARSLVVC